MCGICGIVQFDGGTVQPETIRRMTDSLVHRGPDAEGFHFEPGVGLGHRRLSIIDLNSGQQPISNEDESVWVVFNGEIYNYLELRAMLERKGHLFRTRSDTEVIVHLYEEVGEDCFAQLRGMFAIALFDRKRGSVLLARDHIGKKPLFYHFDGSSLVFGSELKAVVRSGRVACSTDPSAVWDYFTFLYIPSPKSIYREVRKVPAAHYLVFSDGGSRTQPYWDLRFDTENRTEQSWSESVLETLLQAVRIRLMSEVPLGSFLSGGVDSSAVVACMAQILDRPVTTCTVGFDEQPYSEVEHARILAHHVRTEHHEAMVQPNATKVVERLAWHFDEPFADSSAIPTYYVSEAAREHVTVALSGDGGDESFAGYRRYKREASDNRLRTMLPPAFRRSVVGPVAAWYPSFEGSSMGRPKRFLQRLARDPLEGYLARITVAPSVRAKLLNGDLHRELRGYDPLEQFREHYLRAGTNDLLSRIQYLDIKTYLTDDICVKVDRASMAVSLEVRAPLLDYKLMELAARIPSATKMRNGSGKRILRKAVEKMLPEGLVDRPKHGFGVPIAEWFRGPLREWAGDTLFQPCDWLNRQYLQTLWSQHQQGIEDHSAILWAAFMFRQWQTTVDRQSRTDVASCAEQ